MDRRARFRPPISHMELVGDLSVCLQGCASVVRNVTPITLSRAGQPID
jgi:hypothetical protein